MSKFRHMHDNNSFMLLHATDFHIREGEGDPTKIAHDYRKLFLHDAKQLAATLGSPAGVVFSGDMAFSGKKEEYDVATTMIENILEELGLPEQLVYMVPGNHDVSRSQADILASRKARADIRAANDEATARHEYQKYKDTLLLPIDSYQNFAFPYGGRIGNEVGYWEDEGDSVHKGFPVLFRGISTVHVSDRFDDDWGERHEEDSGSHMYVDRSQLTCNPCDKTTPFRILIGHHGPKWWRFSEDTYNMAKQRFHLHLFGHEHEFNPHAVGPAVCVKAGAVNPDNYTTGKTEKMGARYNWINISKEIEGYVIRIWSRVFDKSAEAFVEDPKWPAGQGYRISFELDVEPELIAPEANEAPQVKQAETPHVIDQGAGVQVAPTQPAESSEEATWFSPQGIRYSLLTQKPQVFREVFSQLGYTPSPEQRRIANGLDYYEASLKELLRPDNINRLVEVMKKEGIDVE